MASRKPSAKAPPAPSPQEQAEALQSAMGILGPLLAGVVDLDVFTGADFLFRITDARGRERRFPCPGDIPFPLAIAFFDAYDRMKVAEYEHAEVAGRVNAELATETDSKRAQRTAAPLEAAMQRELEAKQATADAFAAVLELRTRGITGTKLLAEFGGTVLEQWWQIAIMRLNKRRLDAVIEFATGGSGKVEEPPARARAPRRSRSTR